MAGRPTGARKALAIATVSFVLGMAAQSTFLFFLVPAYARVHGLAEYELVAFAGAALATMALGLPAGRLTDSAPRRRVMRIGWGLEGAAALYLAVAPPGVVAMLLASGAMGAGLAFGYASFQSYVADVLRGSALANGYGVTSALAILGSAAGPFAGGAVLARMGREATDVVAMMLAAMAGAAVLLTLVLRTMRTADSSPAAPARFGFSSAVLHAFDPRIGEDVRAEGMTPREKGALRAYAATYALLGLGYGLTAPWFGPRLMDEFGVAEASWGVLLGGSTVLAAVAVYLSGALGRRVEPGIGVAAATNVATAATLVGFAFAPGAGAAAAFFLGRQFFGNVTGPIMSTGLMREMGPAVRGRSFGLTNIAWNLPWALGAAAGGVLLAQVGAWTFVLGAALMTVGPLLGLRLLARARSGAGPDAAAAA